MAGDLNRRSWLHEYDKWAVTSGLWAPTDPALKASAIGNSLGTLLRILGDDVPDTFLRVCVAEGGGGGECL